MAREPSEPRSGNTTRPSREARLAAALRANLKRRKAQRRARDEGEAAGEPRREAEAGRH